MKAILIDTATRTIREVQMKDELDDYHKLIGCDCICIGENIPPNHTLYVDDEGLLKQTITRAFTFNNHLFVGNGLITGIGCGGVATDAVLPVQSVKDRVVFAPEGWIMPQDLRDKLTKITVTVF